MNSKSTAFVCLTDFQDEIDQEGVCLALVAYGHVETCTSSLLSLHCRQFLKEFKDVLADDLPP